MEHAKSKGIFCSANFIIGFPTETWDEIRETIAFAEKLNADYTRIHILVPLKGTKMFEMVENEGLLNERYDHFNQKALESWNDRVKKLYIRNDLTILKVFEWDRLNLPDPKKEKKFANGLE